MTAKGFYNSRRLPSHTSINLQIHSGRRNNEVRKAFSTGERCSQRVDAVGERQNPAAASCMPKETELGGRALLSAPSPKDPPCLQINTNNIRATTLRN